MGEISRKIKDKILNHTDNQSLADLAIIHWKWSQIERIRRSLIRNAFRGLPISNTEEYAMLVVIELQGKVGPKEIADYLNMEKSTISEFVKRCISHNIIKEGKHEKDKRRVYLELTPEGQRVIEQAHAIMSEINENIFGSLNFKTVPVFSDTLVGLLESLDSKK